MRLRALRSSSWLKISLFAMLLACNACSNSGSNSGNTGDGNSVLLPPPTSPLPLVTSRLALPGRRAVVRPAIT